MKPEGRTVLITGGGGGIGAALAAHFNGVGCHVAICGRTPEPLQQVAAGSERIVPLVCDVTDPDAREAMIADLYDRFGKLDILINNAGLHVAHDLTDPAAKAETLEDEFAVNFFAPARLTLDAMPLLRLAAAGPGGNAAIVNISSTLALTPKRNAPFYCASKAALHVWSQAMRGQFEDTGIGVFSVLVPQVETPMTKGRGGRKMTAARLAELIVQGLRDETYEMYPGISRRLAELASRDPRAAELIIRRMTEPGLREQHRRDSNRRTS